MLKIILYTLIYFSILLENVYANQNDSIRGEECHWDNKKNVPCLSIASNISNTSKFSNTGINKIIISKREIDQMAATDLIDVLKTIPDINLTQSGPKGQQASIFMRGTGSNHTLVMINGVPINDQSTTQGLHDFGVDFIQTVQQIEIYSGPSSTHFGTNAIGGAINIILTGDYKDSVSVKTDNKNNYDLLLNKSFIYQDLSSLNFKFGLVNKDSISARIGNEEKDELENFTSNINYEKRINDNLKLYNTTYFRQTIAEYDDSNTNHTGYEGDNKMITNQIGIKNLKNNKKDNLVFYFNGYDREYDERGTIDEYKSNVLGLKLDSSRFYSRKFSYGYGVDYKYDWGEFQNRGSYQASTKGNSDNFALYANFGWNIIENSNISLFLRNDKHKQTGGNRTYKLNLEKKINNLDLGFSTMSGLRNPTLYELFGTDNFGYSGNRNLNPEKSITNEIYTNFKLHNSLDFSIRAFSSRIIDNIEYSSNKYINDSDDIDLKQSGINSELNFLSKDINLKIFSSLLSSKKENNSNQLRRPKKTYGLKILKKFNNVFFGNYNVNINYNHYGKHLDTHSTSFSTIEMDSTDIVDIHLSKELFDTNMFFKISNLFNENYQRPHGYNQENRYITFGFIY